MPLRQPKHASAREQSNSLLRRACFGSSGFLPAPVEKKGDAIDWSIAAAADFIAPRPASLGRNSLAKSRYSPIASDMLCFAHLASQPHETVRHALAALCGQARMRCKYSHQNGLHQSTCNA